LTRDYLRMVPQNSTYQELIVILNDKSTSELTWWHPIANQVISDDPDLVQRLPNKVCINSCVLSMIGIYIY